MRKTRNLLFICTICVLAVSCEKEYLRDDLVPVVPTPPGSGGTINPPAGLLTKLSFTATDLSTVYSYSYSTTGVLLGIEWNTNTAGQSVIYNWTFTRDSEKKCVQILQKVNIAAYPAAGILYTPHYASATATNFDYLTASYELAGLPTKDSIVFTSATNGQITKYETFKDYAGTGYQLSMRTTYGYDIAGNITTVNNFANTGSATLKLIQAITYEYDTKINPIPLGQEAFFAGGERYFSKNNFTKSVTNNYSTSPTVQTTAFYVMQYNTAGKPTSAVVSNPLDVNSTATVTYTYQ